MLEFLIYTWYVESVQSVAQWSINGEIIDNFLLYRKIMLHSMTLRSESVTCVVCSTKGKCYVKRLWFFSSHKKIKNKNVYLLASKNAPPPQINYYLFLHSMIQCSVLSTLARKERLKLCKKSRVANCHLISYPIPLNSYTE